MAEDLIKEYSGKGKKEMEYPRGITEKLHLRIKAYNYTIPSQDAILGGEVKETKQVATDSSAKPEENTTSTVNINLYVPGGIGDSLNATWNDENVVSLTNGKDVSFASSAKALGQVGVKSLIDKFSGSLGVVKSSIAANTGAVMAPNKMLVYGGTDYMKIDLPFEFVPKNNDELISMENIINFFRRASRPSKDSVTKGDIIPLFKYPPIFDIYFINPTPPNATETFNKSMFFTYKTMALTGFDVKFGNNHDSMTYFNTAKSTTKFSPTDAKLSLSFQSLVVSTQDNLNIGS